MYTLFDYVVHIKGIEYILSLLFIAGYILYAELLKPKPFATVAEAGKEDPEFIKKTGHKNLLKTIGKILAAPFIGLVYVVILPLCSLLPSSS